MNSLKKETLRKLYKQDKTLINLKTLKKPPAARYNDSLGDRFAWRLYQRSVAYFLFQFLLLLLPVLASLGSLEEIIKCPFDDRFSGVVRDIS